MRKPRITACRVSHICYTQTMTTLTGIQGLDFVCMAADSQITEDNIGTISITTPKIIDKGKYLLGITGDSRPGDILTYNWTPPAYNKSLTPVQHMGKKVIPSIIDAFNTNGYSWNSNTDDKDSGFDYLLSFDANLFHVACDLSFLQSKGNYYGIGSGGQFAMGYLWNKWKGTNISRKKALEYSDLAIRCAESFDINTGLPIQLVIQERE